MKPFELWSNAVRAKEIVTVLAKYGFQDLLRELEAPSAWFTRFLPQDVRGLSTWERVRHACEELGPAFIKFGQLLSTRADILPGELVIELKKLRSHVAVVDFEAMRTVAEDALGQPLEEVFTEIETAPMASASIAQVYRWRRRDNGEPCAAKVQRPGIERDVRADMEIVAWLARQAHQRLTELRAYDLPTVVAQTKASLLRELDFTLEAAHARIFNHFNPEPEKIFAPKPDFALTSRRLHVSEWVEGSPPEETSLPPERCREIAHTGARSLFTQVLDHGFFHADPHGGNLLLTPDGRLCLLDWGLVGQMTRRRRYDLADLIRAVLDRDAERVVRTAVHMRESSSRPDTERMEKDVAYILRRYPELKPGQGAVGRIMLELTHVLGSHGVAVARDFTLLTRAVLVMEETGHTLDAEFELTRAAEPIFRRLQKERQSPRRLSKSIFQSLRDNLERLGELPGDFQRLIRRFEERNVDINLHHEGLEDFSDTINASANRLSLAVILGSLLIGSSLVITTGIGPLLFGMPALGIVGYLLAAIVGVFVVVDILRHGKHKRK